MVKLRHGKLLPFLLFIFTFITNMGVSVSEGTVSNCSLNFQIPSFFGNVSNCEGGNWGGFLQKNCCGIAFDRYLYGLSQRVDSAREIYLNATEHGNCLTSLKSYEEGYDAFGCGIEKITSGRGGCSDFSIYDVVDNFGDEFGGLMDDCKDLGSYGEWDQACSTCLRTWEEMGISINSKNSETELCRFAVLVSLISKKITDDKLVQGVYRCLGEHSLSSVQEETSGEEKKTKHLTSTGLWILIGGLIGILAVIAIPACVLLRRLGNSNLQPEIDVSEELQPGEPGCHKVPIKEIYSATDNLNGLNFIGQGMAGKVYKGVLSKGMLVAVKHIISDIHKETFVREVRSLSHVRHPNLVSLLGFCEEENECFLVYELCPNGNLSEWLFGKDKVLSWNQRLEIAIDSARGLWFLHSYPEGCIVHRDIKPTNILLGPSFQAKLSDFGLSKVMDLGQSYVSSEVRGTFGYVDPEYQSNHKVTSYGDVYSFGIVLLQILSGKKVINLNLHKPMLLDKMAKFLIRGGNITEFADPKLNGEYPTEAFNIVLKLALSCTAHKQQRPSMEKVVRILEKVLVRSKMEKDFTSYTAPFQSCSP